MREGLDPERIPRHVAVIMDGNGRWALSHGLDRSQGHVEGVNTVRKVTEIASDVGVKYLTLYTFSTENWNRPQEEVNALMHLIGIAISREVPDLIKNNVSLRMIGDFSRIPHQAMEKLEEGIKATAHCTGLVLTLALSYSSRWEITNACREIAEEVKKGGLDPAEIDESIISRHLCTSDMPDPDLLIRTGGEKRVSNYLLWQIAYAEMYLTPKYWPDFSKEDFVGALINYQSRQRRYGKTSSQVQQ